MAKSKSSITKNSPKIATKKSPSEAKKIIGSKTTEILESDDKSVKSKNNTDNQYELTDENKLNIKEFLKEQVSTTVSNDDKKFLTQLESLKSDFEEKINAYLEKISSSQEVFLSLQNTLDSSLTSQLELAKKYKEAAKIILLAACVSIFVSLLLTVVSVFNFSNKASDFDVVTSALANRISTMNSGLTEFEKVGQNVANLTILLNDLNENIENNISENKSFRENIFVSMEEISTDLSNEYQVQSFNIVENYSLLEDRFSGVSSRLLSLANLIENSAAENENLASKIEVLENLGKQIEAFLVLEKEKYFEEIIKLQVKDGDNQQIIFNDDAR
jgi:hypothetical protein